MSQHTSWPKGRLSTGDPKVWYCRCGEYGYGKDAHWRRSTHCAVCQTYCPGIGPIAELRLAQERAGLERAAKIVEAHAALHHAAFSFATGNTLDEVAEEIRKAASE